MHFSPARRQPRNVLRVPRPRGGQQLPHVLLQREDGKGGRLCSGAAGRQAAGPGCRPVLGQIQVGSAGLARRRASRGPSEGAFPKATCSRAGADGGASGLWKKPSGAAVCNRAEREVSSVTYRNVGSGSPWGPGAAARRRSRPGPLPPCPRRTPLPAARGEAAAKFGFPPARGFSVTFVGFCGVCCCFTSPLPGGRGGASRSARQ